MRTSTAAFISLLLLFSPCAAHAVSGAPTVDVRALIAQCPSIVRALRFERQAEEAWAFNDPRRYPLYERAARVYYRCSRSIGDGSPKDYATFAYALDLFWSLRDDEQMVDTAPIVIAALNDLAFATRYGAIRAMALRTKSYAASAYRRAYYALNYTYPSLSSAGEGG